MTGRPYTSSEDSALLRRALSTYAGGAALEIGAGNGGTLVYISSRFGMTVGTDIVRPDMRDWRDQGVEFVLADGGSCFRPSTFDLVAFNPPYLREGVEDRAVQGGEGLEVPKKFLSESLRVVKKEGTVVFLLNDQANLSDFEAICRASGFALRRVESARAFFEELSVFAAVHEGDGRETRAKSSP